MAQCICCGEVVQLPDLADSAADVCINCFGGGDEDLEAVRQTVDKKKKLNKKPAQAAGKDGRQRCEEESISLEDGRSLEGDGISLESCDAEVRGQKP